MNVGYFSRIEKMNDTELMQRAVSRAREIAEEDGVENVGTEYLLLALCEGPGFACGILEMLGVSFRRVHDIIWTTPDGV